MFLKEQKQISNTILHAPSIIENEATGIVYLGCNSEEVQGYLSTLFIFYRCEHCWVNEKPEYLTEFEREIVIPDIQALTNSNTWGLDTLVDSELNKHWGINHDEYLYYSTGSMPA